MRKQLGIKAVWDSDLKILLEKLGILEQLLLGTVDCEVCGRTVDLDNLGAVVRRGTEAGVVCDNAHCVRSVTAGAKSAASG